MPARATVFVLPDAGTSSYDRAMRTVPNALLSLMFVVVSSTACRPATEPSADFEKASGLWAATVQDVEQPGADPRAEEALLLARAVPASSIDAEAAKSLVERIENARRDEAEAAAELQARLEEADEASMTGLTEGGSEVSDDETEGEEESEGLQVGMSEAAFKTLFGACVRVESEFVEARGTRKGQAYALVASAKCKEAHPQLGADLVFVLDGKVFNVAPPSAAIPVVETKDGWKPESGDWPAPAPEAVKEEVAPEDAQPL